MDMRHDGPDLPATVPAELEFCIVSTRRLPVVAIVPSWRVHAATVAAGLDGAPYRAWSHEAR